MAVITCNQIKETKAYQNANKIQQSILNMAHNRKQILSSVLLLQNVGLQKWETLNKSTSTIVKNIVKELAAV